jgi:hypothetical protein
VRREHRQKDVCLHRIGEESAKLLPATGGKPYTVAHRATVRSQALTPTLAELHDGKQDRGSRLRAGSNP